MLLSDKFTQKALEEHLVAEKLRALGTLVPLDIDFDRERVREQIAENQEHWVQYNKNKAKYNRFGLSLFSLEGETNGEKDLTSVYEYNRRNGTHYNEMSFRTPTPIWKSITAISEPLKMFEPYLGRTHILRLDEGGFFPPHRDLGDSFRLISFLNCSPWEMVLLADGQQCPYHRGQLYYLDTSKDHSVFSFIDNALILICNVELSLDAYKQVASHLREC